MISHNLLCTCSEDHVILKSDGNATVCCITEKLPNCFPKAKALVDRAWLQLKEMSVEEASEEELDKVCT